MQSIVETLSALNGVRHVGIYKQKKIISSNFSEEVEVAMSHSSDLVAQIFLALEAVKKTHNEIFIGIDSGYLAGFRLFGGHIALLLTDKKINFPMVSMGVKSASEMLKQHAEELEQQLARQSQVAGEPVESVEAIPTDESLIPVFNQYVYILTEFLGPAASVVVHDAVEQWKDTYVQSANNLPYLVALLENELETSKEKQLLNLRVESVNVPDM